ncbi:uncharacterized protein SCHCODRAFT_02594323, partial [Schizophyllum commune H4-8]
MDVSRIKAQDAALPRFPLELLERIMVFIPDLKTFLNSALVCRALVDVSRRLTFRRIRFSRLGSVAGYSSFKAFEALLESPMCTIPRHIRWVALHWPATYERNLVEPLSCLQRLPNLATLRVEGMRDLSCVIPLHEIGPYLSSKSLTSVSLDLVVISCFDALVRMLNSLGNLQNFSMNIVSLQGGQGAKIMHRPLSKPEGLLARLCRLKCYLQGPLEWGFLWFLLSLPCLPPIAYLDIRLPIAGSGRSERWCKFVHGLRHTLRSLRIHPGFRDFIEAEYTKLDLPQFTSLSSITIEPVLTYNLRTAGTGDCFLSLLLFSLTAPSLSKLTVVFMVDHVRSVDAFGISFDWAVLDSRLERAPCLKEMKFVISACSVIMQLQGVHRKAEENIRKLLPKAHAKGILRVKVASVALANKRLLSSIIIIQEFGDSPTLTALRLDPSDQEGFLELAEGLPLGLASLEHLRSVTIELVVLTSLNFRRTAQSITNLLLCALQPPALRKLTLSFNTLLKSPGLIRLVIEGDVLDGRLEQLPSLTEVKFIFSVPSDFAQMPNLHRDIEELIHGMFPKASARGILQLVKIMQEFADAGL